MNRSPFTSLFFCFLILTALPVISQGIPAPRVSFEESAVVASGLTPGEPVVWFGVEHRVDEEYSTELVRRYDLGTAAADGAARLDLQGPVVRRSCWVAVGRTSGRYAVAAPEGYRVARAPLPPRLGPGNATAPDGLVDGRMIVMGLVVRPGLGAWSFYGGDGGERDADPTEGRVRFDLDQMEPLSGSPDPPARVGPADLWFTVDPLKMEISVHVGGVAQ